MQSTSIDLSSLPEDLVRQLEYTVESYARKHNKLRSWQEVLDHGTDEEILEKAAGEVDKGAPISFARNYETNWKREIVPYNLQEHPRRPVIMRGAVYMCYVNHALSPNSINPNGWLIKVYNRALRMSKKTLVEWDDILEFTESLAAKIADKYAGASYHFWDYTQAPRCGDPDSHIVLMNGRWVFLRTEQYKNVRMFLKVINKTEDLERRMLLLKVARKERAIGIDPGKSR